MTTIKKDSWLQGEFMGMILFLVYTNLVLTCIETSNDKSQVWIQNRVPYTTIKISTHFQKKIMSGEGFICGSLNDGGIKFKPLKPT